MGASIGVTVGVDGENEYVKSLKNITAETKAFQSELKALESSFGKNTSTWDKTQMTASALTEQIGAQYKKIEALREAQSKFAEGSTKYFEYADKINKATDALNKMEKQLESLPNHIQAIGEDFEAWGTKIETAGKSVSKVGDALSKVSLPVAAGLGAAVKETADFEKAMSEAWAVTGALDSSLDELEKQKVFETLEAQAREMGRTTKFTATESAEAIKYMGLAGWDAEGVIAGLPGVINLAAAADMDLARASDIVTDTLTAYGDAQDKATKYADIFAATMSNSNTTVDLMGESLKYIAPVAGAMGYSFEDTAIAIGLMGNAAIKGSTAGTTLRNIMTNMANPTKDMAEAMDVLGVSLDDGQGNMYSFYEIMQQLRGGFGELMIPADELNAEIAKLDTQLDEGTISEDEYADAMAILSERAYGAEGALKAKEAAMLGGKRAMSGLLAIVSASDEDFDKLTQSIYGSTGAAEEMRDVMMDNLSGDLTLLKSELSELAIQFGELMIPVLRGVVDVARSVIDGLSGMDEGTRKAIIKAGLFVAAVGPVLSVGGRLISGIGTIVGGVGKLLEVVGGLAGTGSAVVGGIGSVVGAIGSGATGLIGAIGSVVSGIGSAIAAALPVVGVIAVVVAAVGFAAYEIYKHWDTIKEAWSAGVEHVKQGLADMGNFFKTGFENLKNLAVEGWNAIVDNTKAIFHKIGDVVKDVWDTVTSATKSAVKTVTEKIKTGWEENKQRTKEAWENMQEKVKSSWDSMKEKTHEAVNNIGEKIRSGWETAKQKTQEAWSNIKDAVHSAMDNMKEKVHEGVNNIKDKFESTFNNLVNAAWDWGSNIVSNLGNALSSGISWIGDVASSIGGAISGAISGIASAAWNWGRDIIGNLASGIQSAFSWVTNAVSGVANAIKERLHFSEPDKGPLSDFHTYMPDMMKEIAGGIYKNMGMVAHATDALAATLLPDVDTGRFGARSAPNNTTITNGDVVVNVYGAEGQDVRELARIIEEEISFNVDRRGMAFA